MRYPRLVGSLVLASGFIWLTVPPQVSTAQQPLAAKDAFRKEAKRPSSDASTLMPQFKDGTKDINPKGPDGAKNLDLLKQVAEYLIFKVTHKEFYTSSIERMVDGKKDLGLPEKDKTLDGIISDLERFVLIPDPRSKQPTNQFEYIQEFGKALDTAIASILNDPSNTPPPVKLNAVRLLTVACRSGAKAHAKTVLNLLTDAKSPMYLKYHALKAAENLLAAHDIQELQGPNPWKHSISDADVAALVKAIEAIIAQMNKEFEPAKAAPIPAPAPTPPAAAPPPAKAADPKAKPPEPERKMEAEIKRDSPLDPDVALFIRKQAVRALSKVRLVSIPGPNRTLAGRPGVTLARIAAGDPSFTGGATTAELADAVAGLAGLYIDNNVNMDVVLDAIAAGISVIGGDKVKAGTPGTPDYRKLVPWKKTAAQLTAALNNLRTSPDRFPAANTHRTAIGNLIATCSTYVLSPIEKEIEGGTAAPVNQTMVDDYRKQNPRKSDLLIPNDPDSKVSLSNQQAAGR